MGISHRIIDKELFDSLIQQEKAQGNTIVAYKLAAIPFTPPRSMDELYKPQKVHTMHNFLLLNVVEPMIYIDKLKGKTFIILNGYNHKNLTYAELEDVHLVKGAWAYRLAPEAWQEGDKSDDLADAHYAFNHGEEEAA